MEKSLGYGIFFNVKIKSLEKKIEKLSQQAAKDEVSLIKIKTSKSVVSFVILYSLVLFLTSACTMYMQGAAQHAALKYHFTKSQMSLVVGCRAIGLLFSLAVIGFSARSAHKPFLCMFGVLIASLGTVLFAVPYFVDSDVRNYPLTCSLHPFQPKFKAGNGLSSNGTASPVYYGLSTCSDASRLVGSNRSLPSVLRGRNSSGPPSRDSLGSEVGGSSLRTVIESPTTFFSSASPPATPPIPSTDEFIADAISRTKNARERRADEGGAIFAARRRATDDDDGVAAKSLERRSGAIACAPSNRVDDARRAQGRQSRDYADKNSFHSPYDHSLAKRGSIGGSVDAINQSPKQISSPLDQCTCAEDPGLLARSQRALSVLSLGSFLLGVGVGMLLSVAWVFIEENAEKRKSTLLYGILLMMSGLGQLLGACLFWWLSANAENLERDTVLYPWTIRDWWLGMLILAILLLIISPFFLIFPRWIQEPEWSKMHRIQLEFSLRKKLQLYKIEQRNYKLKKKAKKKKVPTATLR